MAVNLKRVTWWALIVGATLAFTGYAAANLLAPGSGDDVFRYAQWPLFETIAMIGSVIIALGLPAILFFAGKAPKLHIVGYMGIFVALIMLNIGDGRTEAFVKPYLVVHAGIPAEEPAGFAAVEGIAALALVVGSICLGIEMLRAQTLPWWTGVLMIVSFLVGAAGLPGAWFLLPDGLFFLTVFAIGVFAVRGRQVLGPISPEYASVPAAG